MGPLSPAARARPEKGTAFHSFAEDAKTKGCHKRMAQLDDLVAYLLSL